MVLSTLITIILIIIAVIVIIWLIQILGGLFLIMPVGYDCGPDRIACLNFTQLDNSTS